MTTDLGEDRNPDALRFLATLRETNGPVDSATLETALGLGPGELSGDLIVADHETERT